MRVSERQLLVLMDVLVAAVNFKGSFAGYDQKFLQQLYNDLVNQQSGKLVELDHDKPTSVANAYPDLDSSCST